MIIDPGAGASLLDRMTQSEEDPRDLSFNDDQIKMLVEVFIPRMITAAPGFAKHRLTCKVEQADAGWVIRIDKP